jgi:hypothetical protein
MARVCRGTARRRQSSPHWQIIDQAWNKSLMMPEAVLVKPDRMITLRDTI